MIDPHTCFVDKSFSDYLSQCGFFESDYVVRIFQYALLWQLVELFIKYFIFTPTKFLDKFSKAEDKLCASTKMISLLHAIISTFLSFRCINRHSNLIPYPSFPYSTDFDDMLVISIGYFVYDLIVYIRLFFISGRFETSMIAHHIVSLFGVSYSMFYRIGLLDTIALLGTEITTPLLQIRWYLLKLNMEQSKWYKWNGMLFALGFFIFRVVYNSLICLHLLYYAQDYAHVPYVIRFPIIFAYILLALNLFWFSAIVKLVQQALHPAKKSTKTQ